VDRSDDRFSDLVIAVAFRARCEPQIGICESPRTAALIVRVCESRDPPVNRCERDSADTLVRYVNQEIPLRRSPTFRIAFV
jgi:hypothetical protein